MKFSNKSIAILTSIPFIAFTCFNQNEFYNLSITNKEQRTEIVRLNSIIETINVDEMQKVRIGLEKEKQEIVSLKTKAKKELEDSFQIAKRNSDYRNSIVNELRASTEDVKKYVLAYSKATNQFSVELLISAVPKKIQKLDDIIKKTKTMPLFILENDAELKQALDEALITHKYAKNYF